MTPRQWIRQMFRAQAVANGGIIRRKRASVEKYASVPVLMDEVTRRGFHLVETGDQLIVICNKGHIQLLV